MAAMTVAMVTIIARGDPEPIWVMKVVIIK